jgi:ATP synthase protein I
VSPAPSRGPENDRPDGDRDRRFPGELNHGQQEMRRAVRLREARKKRWDREGEPPIWHHLSMAGSLGWLTVTPILLGILLGRWLDRLFDTGIQFTGSLIFLGTVIGAALAWRRIFPK